MNKKSKNSLWVIVLIFTISSCGGRPQPPQSQTGAIQTDTATTLTAGKLANSQLPKCNVSVYIENSVSMDGYVKGVTEFEQAIYSYISDIKLADFCESLNLNYINSQVLMQPDDVSDFIEKLEPSSFRIKGGNRSTTDISNLFQSIMEKQGEDDVAILISDFVFSPGRKKDASEYLTNQQIGIKTQFATKLKDYPNYSAVLYRLVSRFDGNYYNKFDDPTYIKAERPFYIWLLGDKNQLFRLISEIKKENIKGKGVQNTFCISKMSADNISYGILSMPRIGTFRIDPANVKTSILKSKIDKKNPGEKFMVSFGVDYSSYLLEDSYLTAPQNYEINNKAYTVEISKNPNKAISQYSHIIKLKLDPSQPVISRGTIKVSLLKKSAPWADALTDYEGIDINADGAMDKTFGLKTLIDGVYDAYKADNDYATFTINIQ